ncbi:MAG: rod shape-determining protein RodA [Anaerolineaceae bacterium]|nr:rod shape-determining protein RodA [Anaerolineaceae bacterium]
MIQSAIAGNQEIAISVSRQVIFVVGGFVVLFLTSLIDYRYLSSLTRIMYIFSVVILMGIYVIGTAVYGSARWFDTGVILIQPSELVKTIMIVILADYFYKTQDQDKNLNWILKSFLITAFVVLWIFIQPNLSMSIVIFVIWFVLLWYAGLPFKYLLIFAGVGIILGFIGFNFLEDYQQKRIFNFLFPDPTARYGETYNVDQAKISIGSGGLLGMGYGQGSQVQLRFLKVRHTDFIFSAMAHEFGFVGTIFIMSVLVFVIYRCFRVGQKASDMFGQLIAYGVGTLLFFQMAVNIGVNLNVIPVTGLTLPFISYGGSSLASLLLGIGFVESVSAHRHRE